MASRAKGDRCDAGPKSESELSLVAALKAGRESAAEALVRTHAVWMLAVALRLLKDPALAEDCVQEALINAMLKIDSFEGRSNLKSWLHRIVVNRALMCLRVMAKRNETPIDEFLPALNESASRLEGPWQRVETPEEVFERARLRESIHSKIAALPENYRLVLVLRDIEEMSTKEVADTLGLSEANVRIRLHRARLALKALLERLL